MPIIDKKNKGEINNKQFFVTSSVFLIGAIIIVAFYLYLLQKQVQVTNESIINAQIQVEKKQKKDTAQTNTPKEYFQGSVVNFTQNQISIRDELSEKIITVELSENTQFSYNSKKFNLENIQKGDIINVQGSLESSILKADFITVIISTSPNTENANPNPANTRPDGSIRPL